jgi:hypothetical protein
MKIYCAHSTSFDFNNEYYLPLKHSELSQNHELIFPHENNQFIDSKEIVKNCELIIAEVSYPSIGEGIELGWANDANISVICLYKEGSKVSKSLNVISKIFISYASSQDLISKLSKHINSL